MNDQIFELEEKFQPFLLKNDYTFIGPIDIDLLQQFIMTTNRIAPKIAILCKVHQALSNKNSIRKAILTLPLNTELRVYVIISNGYRDLFHTTIEEYCKKNNIDFENFLKN
jgi:hypothetical protein